MYYAYKYESCNGMIFNRWGSNTLDIGPLVVFRTKEDMKRWIGEEQSNKRESIQIEELWGLWGSGGWHTESTRDKFMISESVFESREQAEKAIAGNKKFEVLKFYTKDGDVEMAETEKMSPLKQFLRVGLIKALWDSNWDFDDLDHAKSIVDSALNNCDFKDEEIFRYVQVQAGQNAIFPTMSGADIPAFVTPKEGKIPDRCIEGSDIFIPTFKVGNAISWNLDYGRDRRHDVLGKAIQQMAQGYIDKVLQEQNRIIGSAASSKNKVCCETGDVSATGAIHEMISQMRMSGRKMTDVYMAPEAYSSLVNELRYPGYEQDTATFCGVNVHVDQYRVDEMEETHYDSYSYRLKKRDDDSCWRKKRETFRQKLVRWLTFAPRTHEFVIEERPLMFGIDRGDDLDGFDHALIMPFRNESSSFFADKSLHRSAKDGIYGWLEMGFGCLDPRVVVAGAYEKGEEKVLETSEVETRLSGAAAFVLPLKRTGGARGWFKRFW